MKQEVINSISKTTKLPPKQISNLIEIPPNPEMGDYAFPCFILSKKLKQNPIEIASKLSKEIKSKSFEKVESKGPYINFFVDKIQLAKQVLKEDFTKKKTSKKKEKIMIEFSQANTHKAFHIGHIRGTSTGESLARISEYLGNLVIRANYQGDAGMHVAKWLWCYQKYHSKEPLKNEESWISSIYVDSIKRLEKDPDSQEEVNKINQKLEEAKDKKLIELWEKTRRASLNAFEKIYKDLNTKFNVYYFERGLEKQAKQIAEKLKKEKIAELSDGALIINLEKYNLGIWVLLRSDGTVLYSTKDIVLAEKKFKDYKISNSIYVIGAAQSLHMAQLLKTLELMKSKNKNKIKFISYSEVRLPTGKMSSRTGENVLYNDFKKEITDHAKKEIKKRELKLNKKELEKRALIISVAALKYSMLKQDSNKNIIFDKEESLNFDGNTGPYLLYTYARAKSILRKAKNKNKKFQIKNMSQIEKELVFELSQFPDIVENAYKNLSPNIIANYAYQISQKFNEFYHSSKVIGSEEEQFKLQLVESFSQVLKTALNLLGIGVLEKM